jgi:1,4-dihydroxy-2-naphthoate octaprenyltransferase
VGFLACSLLVVNNLRDRVSDEKGGKRTLAVRLGDRRTRLLYVALLDGSLVLGSLCALSRPWAVLVLVAGLMAGPSVRRVLAGAVGPDLVDVLAQTGRIQMTAGALLALGLALSA